MKMTKEITTYCPKCNTHTKHGVKVYSKGSGRGIGLNIGTRRRNRKLLGYHGKIKGPTPVKKVSKRQKVLLKCIKCSYITERVMGTRTKKKLETT